MRPSSILPSSVSTPARTVLEGGDHPLGPVDLLRRRREHLVDDRDLVGMDGDLAAIAMRLASVASARRPSIS